METLESRRLMSVSIAATKAAASDINPTGSGKGVYTVTRTDSTKSALVVSYSVGGTASTSRYEPLSGTLTIPAHKNKATINLIPLLDASPHAPQTVQLSLTPSSSYTINARKASATVTITDKAPTVSIVTTRAAASEKDPTGTGLGQFQVKRVGQATGPVVVNYSIDSASTAINGVDFQPLSGSVTIPKGKTTALINVTPIADHLLEPTRTLTLDLGLGGYFQGQQNKASLSIADDGSSTTPRADVLHIATTTNASEATPSTPGVFTVTRSGDLTSAFTATYTVSGTAVSGTDYAALSGSVVIAAGQSSATIDVTPTGSATTSDQTVIVTLTNANDSNTAETTATLTIAHNTGPVITPGWWNTAYHYRLPLAVNVGSTARTDKPVDQQVNFTQTLSALGGSGSLNENSIRVIETTADGSQVLNANVPFQFDKASDYNAATNASGDLVFLMTGATAANTTRYYHMYFDTGSGFTAANVTPLVMTTDNTTDAGQTAVTIVTPTATYDLQKDNGGFSSIVDSQGNDWLSFDPTPGSGSGGEYRGLPNAVFNGGFHAGFNFGSTQVVSTGPLKTTLITTITVDTGNANGPSTYQMKYEIYPTYVTATMLRADDTYWFLYEGTPGGATSNNQLNLNNYVVQSDGTQTPISQTFNDDHGVGNGNGQQWLYFESAAENRYLFMVKNQASDEKDDYYDMNDQMTVFGFGRDNSQTNQAAHQLSGTNSFTFGLADGGSNFSAASTQINATYQPLTTTASAGQSLTQ